MRVENIRFDKNGVVTCVDKVSNQVYDMFFDIGAGICNTQKFAEAMKENSKFDTSKVKQYQPKTQIPKIIEDVLNESEYWKGYEWQHQKEFMSNGVSYKVVRYDVNTSDWCLVEKNGKEIRISKKYLKELWERSMYEI